MTSRRLLTLNLGTIALFAPAFILAPTLLSGYHLTPWHWAALVVGLASALVLVALTVRRERAVAAEARKAERDRAAAIAQQILSDQEADRPAQQAVGESARAERDSSD